jgi:putative flippase GtrA
MARLKHFTLYLYHHHFVRYLLVGGSTFLIDFGLLYLLHGHFNLNLGASTSVAYWVSIAYNFTLNRYWTFDAREKESLARHISSYFILLIFNYLFTVTFVSILGEHYNYIAVKALAVGIQMIWTYPVYKKFIFVSSQPKVDSK